MSGKQSYLGRLQQVTEGEVLLSPGVLILVENPQREVLLERRRDNGLWGLPGGGAELGETFAGAAVRELQEETGLTVEESDLIPIACLSDPETQVWEYPDGQRVHYFSLLFRVRRWLGDLLENTAESTDARFWAIDQLPESLTKTARRAIELHRKYEEAESFQVR